MKPAIEDVENCKQASLGVRRAALDLRFKPLARPYGFPAVKKCYREINLGIEIAVKAGFSAA